MNAWPAYPTQAGVAAFPQGYYGYYQPQAAPAWPGYVAPPRYPSYVQPAAYYPAVPSWPAWPAWPSYPPMPYPPVPVR